jgi:malonate transporter and related proteins
MSAAVLAKLLAIIVTVGLGWLAGRLRWLGEREADPARILSNAAFYIFVPALLFRTTARVDLGHLPAGLLAGYFVPTIAVLLVVYGTQHWRQRRQLPREPALPATRATAAIYGNAVQMGVPMAAAMFGEAGLGIHLMLVSAAAPGRRCAALCATPSSTPWCCRCCWVWAGTCLAWVCPAWWTKRCNCWAARWCPCAWC